MSEYTPSTEEVRTDYIMAYTERQSSQLLAGLAFDRWHAAELRRAKAEALKDVIDEIAGMGVEPWNRLTPAIKLLAARADQIEEANNDHP